MIFLASAADMRNRAENRPAFSVEEDLCMLAELQAEEDDMVQGAEPLDDEDEELDAQADVAADDDIEFVDFEVED